MGNGAFACSCEHAPASANGLLALSSGGLATPVVVLGAAVWIDPAAPGFLLVAAPSNAIGASRVTVPIPANAGLIGAQAFVQFFWADVCAARGVSASNALRLTVQP